MSTNITKKGQSNITVVHGLRDCSKDPFVVKKLESARAFIAKHGLPKDSRQKKNS